MGLPIHLHTHDTSGLAGATILAAVDAGVDAFDAAMDAMSGTTSQPCLGSLVEALRGGARDPSLDTDAIRQLSFFWEAVRGQYAAFESDLRSGASEVYLHELPGGQFTNLREQARALGLDARWHEVARAYRAANDLFGDIIKVTPSSKVVGDMALMMVSQGLSAADVLSPAREIAFPQSVVEMLRGDLGQPPGGWPADLQRKVLKGETARTVRPGQHLPPADLEAVRQDMSQKIGRQLDDRHLASALLYPKVFADYCAADRRYGPVSVLPTPVFFYGMAVGDEVMVQLAPGKALVVRLQAIGETDEEGFIRLFFELNGQPRVVKVPNRAVAATQETRPKAEADNDAHVAAPMPGLISELAVREGDVVGPGDVLMSIEAMKMESLLHAPRAGRVAKVWVKVGATVDAKDLVVELDLSAN